MTTKTRFKLTLIAGAFLSLMALVATLEKMETLATTCAAGIMTILSTYIWSQTRRPSKTENDDADDDQK